MSERGRQMSQSGRSEKEAKVGVTQGHEPSNADGLQKLGKVRNGISPKSPGRNASPANTLILASET